MWKRETLETLLFSRGGCFLWIPSRTPNIGDSFQIMTFASLVGTFGTITGLDLGNGTAFYLAYNSKDVTLTVK